MSGYLFVHLKEETAEEAGICVLPLVYECLTRPSSSWNAGQMASMPVSLPVRCRHSELAVDMVRGHQMDRRQLFQPAT